MRIIAVDPGETIGVAFWNSDKNWHWVGQFDNAKEAEEAALDLEREFPDHYIVENYHSAGYLSKEGKHTIKVLGLFELAYGYTPVAPQARLAFVDRATEMIGDEAKTMHRKGRDAISALAHALAYADSKGAVNGDD